MSRRRVEVQTESRADKLATMGEIELMCRAEGHWWKTTFGWGAELTDPNDRRKKRHYKNHGTWEKVCVRDGDGCGTTTTVVTGPQAQRIPRGSKSEYEEDYKLPGPKPAGGTKAEARRELLARIR
jgi:hypothetical protein